MKFSIALVALVADRALAQGGCSPLELVYARATTEPVGFGFAGSSLKQHLAKDLPGSVAYAVEYPASMDLNGGGCQGAQDIISHINDKLEACPNTKFALGGHSQGGAVVAAVVPHMRKEVIPKIVAVTMFGSPPCSDIPSVKGRCKSFCNKGDTICDSKGAMGGGGPRVKCGKLDPNGTKKRGSSSSGGKSRGKGKGAMITRRGLSSPNNQPSSLEVLANMTTMEVTTNSLFPRAPQGKGKAGGKGKGSIGGGGGASGGGGGVNGCGDDEKGHVIKGGGTGMAAHMAYNQDGYYVAAASCYITKLFKASSGGAGAAQE